MAEVHLFLFVVASLVVIINPGQDLLPVMSRAVSQVSKAVIMTTPSLRLWLRGHSILSAATLQRQ